MCCNPPSTFFKDFFFFSFVCRYFLISLLMQMYLCPIISHFFLCTKKSCFAFLHWSLPEGFNYLSSLFSFILFLPFLLFPCIIFLYSTTFLLTSFSLQRRRISSLFLIATTWLSSSLWCKGSDNAPLFSFYLTQWISFTSLCFCRPAANFPSSVNSRRRAASLFHPLYFFSLLCQLYDHFFVKTLSLQ